MGSYCVIRARANFAIMRYRLQHSTTIHVFHVSIGVSIVGQFPSDYLLIKLHIIERLNLPDSLQILRLVVIATGKELVSTTLV